MRLYKNIDELFTQVEYFVDAVASYNGDFVLFPEYFNAPLMADYNHLGLCGGNPETGGIYGRN